ncbi:unnamed protein product [Camellia sinensis]
MVSIDLSLSQPSLNPNLSQPIESAFFSLDLISKRLVIHLRSNLRAIGNFDFEISKLHCLHHLHRREKQGPSSTKDQSNGVSSLANVKCKLLHWEGSNLVVAKGQIASRDPKSKVHHATLRPLCWKVWVNHVTVNVPLFRSTREMYDPQDAIGSTVAWPSQFIILD